MDCAASSGEGDEVRMLLILTVVVGALLTHTAKRLACDSSGIYSPLIWTCVSDGWDYRPRGQPSLPW